MAAHEIVIRVYIEDTDAGGVVYHARYLAFAERARTEALRAQGASVTELRLQHGLAFVVANLEISYRRPLRLDDLAEVKTSVGGYGAVRVQLNQVLWRGGEIIAEMQVTLACVRLSDLRPARIPARWQQALGTLNKD